jgi:hypothetical protein
VNLKGELMPNNSSGMTVHAGRAVLEQSNNFTNEGKVVGEYVKNSWQYTDGPTVVNVLINQKNKSIQIKDTSRGMDRDTLDNNFFVLHGVNEDRKVGKFGRGEFGTGKVAALGIGETLRVKTIKDNKLHIFEIHRKDCDADISLNKVKIRWIKEGENTKEENGTTIEILNFRQERKISVRNIKSFLSSKTLVEEAYEHPIKLYVDHEKIERIEIDYIDKFIKKPTEEEKKFFGECTLTIKVATRNLNEEERGISIFAKGIYKAKINNPHGEKNEFIFGECTCDKLIEESNPPIFNSSRREELNIDNDVAKSFLAFVNYHVDTVRKELVKKDSDRKKKERNEALQKEADKMREFFNSDYKELELSYQKKIAKAKGNIDDKQDFKFQLGETKIVTGDDFSVKIVEGDDAAFTEHGRGESEGGEGGGGQKPIDGKIERTDEETKDKGKEKSLSKKRSGGGFNFEWAQLGIGGKRAIYEENNRVIKINLDHPFISKILQTINDDKQSPIFLRAAYEAAIFEYAVAVTQQKSSSNFIEDSVSDAIFEIQDCVDRMLKKMAKLNLFNE